MQSWGGYERLVIAVAGLVAGAGCGVGGGTLSGTGGSSPAAAGHGGAHSVIVPTGGAGAVTTTGAGGSIQACGAVPQPAVRLFPWIEIVLDTSASMNGPVDPACGAGCFGPSKWAASVDALNTVVDATLEDVGWALSFIGGAADACDLGRVATIVGSGPVRAGLALLTSNGALATPGQRPTRAAIDRATRLIPAEGSIDPRVILLITDGTPNCGPDATDARADDVMGTVTSIANALTIGTSTFVVGLGIAGGATDAALDDMAIAGGLARSGSPAYYAASSPGEIVAAMNVLLSSTDCTFWLPPPPMTDGTTSRDFIQVVAGDLTVPQDFNDGWTYADATHTTIQLHGSSCASVRSGGETISISFRCPLP